MMPSRKPTSSPTKVIAEIGTHPLVIFLTVLLILASLAYSALFARSNIPNNVIRDTVLPGLICVVLIAVLLQQFLIRTGVDALAEGVSPGGRILYPPLSMVSEEMTRVITSASAESVLVICYGTNKLNDVLDHVTRAQKKVQVVICSDDCEALPDDRDKPILKAVYEELSSKRNVTVSKSTILPTIRAVVIRNKKRAAIWCYMQPYHIHEEPRGMHGEGTSPAIVADDPKSELMAELSKYIASEFDRLKATAKVRDKMGS